VGWVSKLRFIHQNVSSLRCDITHSLGLIPGKHSEILSLASYGLDLGYHEFLDYLLKIFISSMLPMFSFYYVSMKFFLTSS